MKAQLEIVATPGSGHNIRQEFERLIDHARTSDWRQLKVLFGFAWGNYVYPDEWREEIFSPDELCSRVRNLENQNDGSIGTDDLSITVVSTGLRYTFCHENDIHLEGFAEDPGFCAERIRLQKLGWRIHELKNTSEQGAAANP